MIYLSGADTAKTLKSLTQVFLTKRIAVHGAATNWSLVNKEGGEEESWQAGSGRRLHLCLINAKGYRAERRIPGKNAGILIETGVTLRYKQTHE